MSVIIEGAKKKPYIFSEPAEIGCDSAVTVEAFM